MKTYNIVVLGAPGSGKTVFLASMYNKLSTQRDDIKFFLSVSSSQRTILVEKYEEIARSGNKWPLPTQRAEISKWEFTCKVRSEDGNIYSALKFNYLDYAGEHLTNAGDEESEFEMEVKKASALLGILDGHKILALMRDEPFPGGSIQADLAHILPEMDNNKNPVHFVITKWDLLEKHFTLEEIRTRLLKNDKFKQFVKNRRAESSPIRLIPVSSVGTGFATPIVENGKMIMKKNPGVDPNPFQVEMPLACTLPDKLIHEIRQIEKATEKLLNEKTEVKPEYTVWDSLKQTIGGALETLRSRLPQDFQFANPILKDLIEYSFSSSISKEEEAAQKTQLLRQQRDLSLKAVKDEETSINHAINSFKYLGNKLQRKFPESDLSINISNEDAED